MMLDFEINKKREKTIKRTSLICIVLNLIISSVKIFVGMLTHSIAIICEGVNNATDVFSSLFTLIGTKLSQKKPDKNHPFGYGRSEYLIAFVISAAIFISGVKMFANSVNLIFYKKPLDISLPAVLLIIVFGIVKLFLGCYTVKTAVKTNSQALKTVGIECLNDCMVSLTTIISMLIFIIFKRSLDAYTGALTSALIICSGARLLKESTSNLIGRGADKALADEVFREIINAEGIDDVRELIFHNYGPNVNFCTARVCVEKNKTPREINGVFLKLKDKIKANCKTEISFETETQSER